MCHYIAVTLIKPKLRNITQKYDVVWKGNKTWIFNSWGKCKRASTALRSKV